MKNELPTHVDHMRNACVLRALREVSGKPDAEVIAACVTRGYHPRKGMFDHQWWKAAGDLGLDLHDMEQPLKFLRSAKAEKRGLFHYDRASRPTLGEVAREFDVGVFLVTVRGHMLVVRDGRVIDDCRHRGAGRKVYRVVRVRNPASSRHFAHPPGEFVRVIKHNPKRPGTGAWDRYLDMANYVFGFCDNYSSRERGVTPRGVTVAELFEKTPYLKRDLDCDLREGNVVLTTEEVATGTESKAAAAARRMVEAVTAAGAG